MKRDLFYFCMVVMVVSPLVAVWWWALFGLSYKIGTALCITGFMAFVAVLAMWATD